MRRTRHGIGGFLTLLVLVWSAPALGQARASAPADAAGLQCRATCAAGPRDDRARLLACLQRCGVTVQSAAPARTIAATPRLTQGSGYGKRVAGLPTPTAPQDEVALAARPGAAAQSTRWGAIYAAPAPFAGLGAVSGQRDRLAAHGRAESACAAGAGGQNCRMLVEFTAGCAAAARAERGNRVAFTAAEAGATADLAARAALGACQQRVRDTSCRIVQTVCMG
jgi:hypothetical protein